MSLAKIVLVGCVALALAVLAIVAFCVAWLIRTAAPKQPSRLIPPTPTPTPVSDAGVLDVDVSVEGGGLAMETPLFERHADPEGTSRRFLLAIGANHYVDRKLPTLPFCSNDARSLAQLLGLYGYRVFTLDDGDGKKGVTPTLANVRAALSKLADNHFELGDFLWVHFSSHGMLSDDKKFLLLTDSSPSRPEQSALPLDEVVHLLKASGAQRWLLTLDACHLGMDDTRPNLPGGNHISPGLPPPIDPQRYLRMVSEMGAGTAILSASTKLEEAADSSNAQHGVFTQAILATLADGGRRLDENVMTVDDLKNSVTYRVREWSATHVGSGKAQDPSFRVEATGDLIVIDYRALKDKDGTRAAAVRALQ